MSWATKFAVVGLFLLLGAAGGPAQVVINEISAAASDRNLHRSAGGYPKVGITASWLEQTYDDSLWRVGIGPLGFGWANGATIATDLSSQMQNRAVALYLRKKFTVSAADATNGAMLQLVVSYNDGFIAFINGVEVARRNMGGPGMFAFRDQTAFNVNMNGPAEIINLGAVSNYLSAGENLLCIQGHNQSLTGVSSYSFVIQADLQIPGGTALVTHDMAWRYFPGLAEPSGGLVDYGLLSSLGLDATAVAWAARNFNDSTWPIGFGPIGIEGSVPPDYALGLNLYDQAYNITPSIYTRRIFSVTAVEALALSPLRLTLDYDDGVIVYLNGKEVVRRNLAEDGLPAAWDSLAETEHDADGDHGGTVTGQEEIVLLAPPLDLLVSGDNVLAVQLHRASLTSPDAVARVTLETTGVGSRVLVQPTDLVSYFIGTEEPFTGGEQEDTGPLEEMPDSESDWIELHNLSGTEVNLSGWSLTDDADDLRKWTFPASTTISAGGFLVVVASGLNLAPTHGATYLHSNFKLASSGEYLGLVNAVGEVVDQFTPAYPPQSDGHSYGRASDASFGFFTLATPGAANVGTALLPAPMAPAFSVSGGFYDIGLQLTLSTTPDAQIYLTLDGSRPNPGLLYTNPIPILNNTIVRARALHSNSVPSRVLTHTYLIAQSAARKSLPALCLGGDPALTFYGPNTAGGPTDGEGIFAIKGGTYVNGDYWSFNNDPMAFNFPKLLGRASEKQASLEFFPLTGETLRTDFGLRLAASPWSRDRLQLADAASQPFAYSSARHKPSFNLFFRSEWGERPLDYPFFAGSRVTRFESLRIRAGKNDIANPFIRDELIRRIYRDTGQKSSVGVFNTVYINGVYKGYFNLCERLRQGFMQQHHGSSETWDVQQVNDFTDGDPIHWNKMMTVIRWANLTSPSAYQQVHEYLDVDNFIDYLIVNAYVATADWPNNNWVAARERSPQGRWRFYVWDAEGGLGQQGRQITYNTFTSDLVIPNPAAAPWYLNIPALYSMLRVSPEFRLRFADRVQKQLFNGGALVKTNMQMHFQVLRDSINPIIQETTGLPMDESFYQSWIVSDTRRTNFFNQLVGQNLWPTVLAPELSSHGGMVTNGFPLTLSNPNSDGTIYFTTSGADPRAPGGDITGVIYQEAISVTQSTLIKARVRSNAGEWSPVVTAQFLVPELQAEFLPTGSGDWTSAANWTSYPLPYPNTSGAIAIIPPQAAGDRNVNLRAPVTVGEIRFPQSTSTNRKRLRDQNTGNTLTFDSTNGQARIEVGGTHEGYVEFEVLAGTTLQSDLRLHVTNLIGNADFGALRLRANWSGPGGLIKSGAGVASLTGDAKTYSGHTAIEEGVLFVTQPATPTAGSGVTVQSGGQLRLVSGSDGAPRVYTFGGPLSLAGMGRGADIPDSGGYGKLGALRYEPGGSGNQAAVANPILMESAARIHVEGAGNWLTLAGALSGIYPLTKSGGGIMELAADSSGYSQLTHVENGHLVLTGHLGGPIQLAGNATLSGSGTVGFVAGTGNLRLNQTLLQAAGIIGLNQQFVFGKTGSPLYAETNQAGNGVLVVPAAPVAPQSLDIYLAVDVVPGAQYRGGFFVPFGMNLAAALAGVPMRVFAADPLGGHTNLNQNWTQLADVQITIVAEAADFGSGLVQGRTIEVRVGGAPATFAAWQAPAFPNPTDLANSSVSGPGADPNGSGVPNLLRYALGLGLNDDPATRAPEFAGTPAAPALRFPFDSGRNDIAYVVEATSDVANWSVPTVLFDSQEDFPADLESGWLTVSDPAPSSFQRYYRLRVLLIAAP